MRNDFSIYDDLLAAIQADKHVTGALASPFNRYPVRFVLFDNFQDSYQFVESLQNEGCTFKSVSDWIDAQYPDCIITYSELANKIIDYAKTNSQDCIITPFSELARFYNNANGAKEFDALIGTIKGIENSSQCVSNNRRIYIPIVGLEGKMSSFENDSQTLIYYLHSNDKSLSYNLIMASNTDYGIQIINQFGNIAKNVSEWLNIWKQQPVKQNIISTSSALFANAEFAQPDNAFNFVKSSNAFEFLTKGLKLNFGDISYKPQDEKFWQQLASEINIQDFSLDKFFNSYFHIDNLANYNVFLKTWFECQNDFEKWLLTTYYDNKFCQNGYICQAIHNAQNYTNNEFFSSIALTIFSLENSNTYIDERSICLKVAAQNNIQLSEDVQYTLQENLNNLAQSKGYNVAIKYFTSLTPIEKALAIEWFANEKISSEDLQPFFSDLYAYLAPNFGAEQQWINEYFDLYKHAKLTNEYTHKIGLVIQDKNASSATFNSWYQELKTTKTILSSRSDIDVYYWIDGLGVEWIPFIKNRIEQKAKENIYLNEVYVARAKYPTVTKINKVSLQELANDKLKKCGDLDFHAHKNANEFPTYIIEELEIVNKAIDTILSEYNGKKIAIVSDHGLTALSQLCDGLNMAGVESDHNGRLAIRKNGKNVSSEDYIICDDEQTLCALKHKSLCAKVPSGQSAHGGCTPEEILVPIFIISSNKQTQQWSAILITRKLSANNSIVRYSIKNLSNAITPYIEYDGKQYELSSCDNKIFESRPLTLNESQKSISLVVDDKTQIDKIEIQIGAEENELFGF